MKFHLDSALAEWRRELRMHPGIEPSYREELESNLLDRMDDLIQEGLSEEAAFFQASQKTLECVEELADEYYKVRAVSNKKPRWKRKDDPLDFLPSHLFFAYLKHALRSFRVARSYFWINLLGLTLGIAAVFILVKYVSFEWRTDSFHQNYERMVMASFQQTPHSIPELSSPQLYLNLDLRKYPEVEFASQVILYNESLSYQGKNFQTPVAIVDSNFFKVFDFEVDVPNPATIMEDPSSILISDELSNKIFRDENPLGKRLVFEGETYLVKGLLIKPRVNSSMEIDALIPVASKRFWHKGLNFDVALLKSPESLPQFNEKVKFCGREYKGEDKAIYSESLTVFLPYREVYYNTSIWKEEYLTYGNTHHEFVLIAIAALILLISLLNFLNLYAVILAKRKKELSIRRIIGAGKKELFWGLFFENTIISLLAITLSSVILLVFSQPISHFIGKDIFLDREWDMFLLVLAFILLVCTTTLFPFLGKKRLQLSEALKDRATGRKSLLGRKILMTLQFVWTISLVVVSVFFAKQLVYLLDADLGFDPKNVVEVEFFPRDIPIYPYRLASNNTPEYLSTYRKMYEEKQENLQYLINQIEQNPYLSKLSFGNSLLDTYEIAWKKAGSNDPYVSTHFKGVTLNYFDLFKLPLLEGRFFEKSLDQERENKVIINERAANLFGIDSIGGSFLHSKPWGGELESWEVIGIVKNFYFQHLSFSIQPLVMGYFDDREDGQFMVHIQEGKEQQALRSLKELYHHVNPNDDFSYQFVEDEVKAQYVKDRKVVWVYGFFTLIALLISAMGLFGISSYDVQLRIKEIGIRKISGASIGQIIRLLTRDFFQYLLIAIVLACPLAAIAVKKYLEGFAHRTNLSLWVFVVAICFTLSIAMLTMWSHSYRAARRNPIEALRYE